MTDREINSFDNPELVADMLTIGELNIALAHAFDRDNLAAVVVLERELEWRIDWALKDLPRRIAEGRKNTEPLGGWPF